jgi:hypothetical protein
MTLSNVKDNTIVPNKDAKPAPNAAIPVMLAIRTPT